MDVAEPERRRILAATSVSYVVVILDTSIVNVALERLSAAFSAPIEGLQWVVNGYTVSFAALLLTGGRLGDRYGARNAYLAGLGLFTLASLLCACATGLFSLVAARVLQGIGAALLVPGSLKLIDHASPNAEKRARAIGLWAGCGAIAMAAGPVVGGILIDSLGWRSIFFVNVPIGAAGMAMTWRIAHDGPRVKAQPLDILGQVAAIIGLVGLIGVLIEAPAFGWTSPAILIGATVTLFACTLFVAIERRGDHPMLPVRLFRSAVFTGSVYVSCASAFVFYGLLFVLSLTFQQVRGWTAFETGLALLPMTTMVAAGSMLSAAIVKAIGSRRSLSAAFLVYPGGAFGLILAGTTTSYAYALPALLAIGFASGFISPAATAPALGTVEKERVGIAAGVLNAARQAGAAAGVAILGSQVTETITQTSGTNPALWLLAVVSVVTACIWWRMSG
ncbi:drug resistance transporter, EmrB/QacA subfamily [Rhizobium freirei PRF 81]|uniref:Drug resistance transporter, EmrB/QacA subfamily n=1 Tax=Rhizobium freirei PRF 81 TaxID=363754 RepID=N6UUV3_9HYPH|nr:MFS transporter [Rhizobium freirei]ENN84541.1 drug resistance transporter, EmrB/QacA subfamily [Rhizobium freirei PRF 81]